MGAKVDYVKKKFGPQLERTLRTILSHKISREFPRVGGSRICDLCAEMVLEAVFAHMPRHEHQTHGQVVWMAYSRDDPPSRGKTAVHTDMLPVVLDLICPDDIHEIIQRLHPKQRLLNRALRLCQQAYEQGALLSNIDLSLLLNSRESDISSALHLYEAETQKIVPRRATLHDVGSGMTHKNIICRKKYLDGKTSDVIARETNHSIEAVDIYLAQFDRVRHCRLQGMDAKQTAYILECSVTLVHEYLKIDNELRSKDD